MWRGIEQPIGRHDAVLARATDPVAPGVIVAVDVKQLNASFARYDVVHRGLVAVAPVMMPQAEPAFLWGQII